MTATMTVEDYLALDAGLHRHAELVNGMLTEVNPPHGRHQLMAANLLVALRAVAAAGHSVLQEWGWVTRAGRSVREPDLMVVPSELVDAAVLTQPPLLAVVPGLGAARSAREACGVCRGRPGALPGRRPRRRTDVALLRAQGWRPR